MHMAPQQFSCMSLVVFFLFTEHVYAGLQKFVFEYTPLNIMSESLVRKEGKFSARLTESCSIFRNPLGFVSQENQEEPGATTCVAWEGSSTCQCVI